MAKIEPITGRYVWVPYEGEEYRIFFEEAGEGIPMVCLHTAGTDSESGGINFVMLQLIRIFA